RLIGQHVGGDAAFDQGRQQLGDVGDDSDRQRLAFRLGIQREGNRLVDVVRHAVEIAGVQPAFEANRVDVGAEKGGAVHGGGQRLCPAHAAEAAGDDDPALEAAAEVP